MTSSSCTVATPSWTVPMRAPRDWILQSKSSQSRSFSFNEPSPRDWILQDKFTPCKNFRFNFFLPLRCHLFLLTISINLWFKIKALNFHLTFGRCHNCFNIWHSYCFLLALYLSQTVFWFDLFVEFNVIWGVESIAFRSLVLIMLLTFMRELSDKC